MDIRIFAFTTTSGESFEVPFIVDDDWYTNGYAPDAILVPGNSTIQDLFDAFKNSEFGCLSDVPFYYPSRGAEKSDSVISTIGELFPSAKPIDFTSTSMLYIGSYNWYNFRIENKTNYFICRNGGSTVTTSRFPLVYSYAGNDGSDTSARFNFKCNVIPSSCINADGSFDFSEEKLSNGFAELSLLAAFNYAGNYGSISCSVGTTANAKYGTQYTLLNGEPTSSLTNYVTGISITSNSSVAKGGYLIVAANVSGEGDFDKSCTATLSGASSSTIAKLTNGQNWMVECSSDETASEITVTVTSDADPTITASKTITVVEAGAGTGGDGTGGDSGDGTGGSGDGTGDGSSGGTPEGQRSLFMAGLATGLALYSRKG